MQIETSPFLHRDERPQHSYRTPAQQIRDQNDKVKAAYLLSALQYRWYQRRGDISKRLSFHGMQKAGDAGRKSAWIPMALALAYWMWIIARVF